MKETERSLLEEMDDPFDLGQKPQLKEDTPLNPRDKYEDLIKQAKSTNKYTYYIEPESTSKFVATPTGNLYKIIFDNKNKPHLQVFDEAKGGHFRKLNLFDLGATAVTKEDHILFAKSEIENIVKVYSSRVIENKNKDSIVILFNSGQVQEGKPSKNGNRSIGDGIIKITWPDGDEYLGGWKDGLEHGQGTMILTNGYSYQGNWDRGEQYGEMVVISPDKKKYIVPSKGEVKYGICIYPNGDKYEGELKKFQMNGKGTLYLSNGEVIEGIWDKDKHIPSNQITMVEANQPFKSLDRGFI